jgi:hypothetical protein
MAGNPFLQDMDPAAAPDPVTPADGPSDASGYAGVTPAGTGAAPAPYDISAPQDIGGIEAALTAAMDLSGGGEGSGPGAGIPDRNSPRQQQAAGLLDSPQGAPAMSVTAGFPNYESSDVSPGANMENPIQGHTADYPGTTQPGVPLYNDNEGGALPGAPPGGSMAASNGGDYPGTVQAGLAKYGTS